MLKMTRSKKPHPAICVYKNGKTMLGCPLEPQSAKNVKPYYPPHIKLQIKFISKTTSRHVFLYPPPRMRKSRYKKPHPWTRYKKPHLGETPDKYKEEVETWRKLRLDCGPWGGFFNTRPSVRGGGVSYSAGGVFYCIVRGEGGGSGGYDKCHIS